MADSNWNLLTASEEFLIDLIEQAEMKIGLIGGYKGNDRVVKLSPNIAVKFGHGVTNSEARTQEFAHQNTNPEIVHVPQVYRFFEKVDPDSHFPKGYLFMEYVAGQPMHHLDLNTHNDIIPRMAQIIAHIGSITDIRAPGPVGGGEPMGYQWGEYGARTTFNSVADLEAWLNKRLILQKKSIDLSSYSLVLCHMDLCLRNMILRKDNTISLLDWGFAGIYPRFFEIASLSYMNPFDESYGKPLLQATTTLLDLTEEEKSALILLRTARAYSLRYRFEPNPYELTLPADYESRPKPPPLPSQESRPS